MQAGVDKIPEPFIKSRIMSYSLEALIRFAESRGVEYPPGTSKEEFIDLIFDKSKELAYELYDATELRRSLSEKLLLQSAPEAQGSRDDALLSLLAQRRIRALEDAQLLMSQERAKTFRRYLLKRGSLERDPSSLLDDRSADFDELRSSIEMRLTLPGKHATLERVLQRGESYLFFIKYVDKIKTAEEMEGRHWDTLVRRVIAVLHEPTMSLEIGTPNPRREQAALAALSYYLTEREDAFEPWSISGERLLSSISDPNWESDAAGSGPVGVTYVDFVNVNLEGKPEKLSLLGEDVILTLSSLRRAGLDLSKMGQLHKVRFVFRGKKTDVFPLEGKFLFLAYMDEAERMSFYEWVSAMGWA